MQIRRILFISFFLILNLVTLSLMTWSYVLSKNALEQEIGRNLTRGATMLMEEVDILLFEGMQNVHSWSRMDIIQEARIGDVDKRLSQFLSDVATGYNGMYHSLFYIDDKHQVIAASKPELLNRVYYTTATRTWAKLPNGNVFLEDIQLSPPPYTDTNLVIVASIKDRYSSENIGQLFGQLEMNQIFHLLDKASSASSGDLYIALLDGEGRTIAASSNLRKPKYLLKSTFLDWKPIKGTDFFIHNGSPVTNSSVLVGYASSAGYHGFTKLGWSILLFQNTDKAFLPTRALWIIFIGAIILTILIAFLASHWISGRIANPLLGLTQWVRNVHHLENQTPPQVGGTLEIRQLGSAFGELLQELKHSREQVIETAKLAVVGEMSAIMAHELRTPLSIMSTSAEWLQKEQPLNPEGLEMTQFILDESARLTRLVTTLLECARPKEPDMHPHNIHTLIRNVVDLLAIQADNKQITINLQLSAKNPNIVCDADLIKQALLNLILNAIQILPSNGLIRIRSISLPQYISIEIADNGPGITAEDYQHLFNPFFTKRFGGIGLGLTVTRQIVLAHQGQIHAQSSEWGGASFLLQVPFTQ